jgi:hypothetical protein
MTSRPLRIFVSTLLAAVALAIGVTLLAQGNAPGPGNGTRAGGGNSVLPTGYTWTVKVTQDATSVVPDRSDAEYATTEIAWKFRVTHATSTTSTVHVSFNGAEGIFAHGYDMVYARTGDAMVLRTVAPAGRDTLAAAHARLIMGQDFPLTTSYTSRPHSHKATKAELPSGAADLPPPLPTNVTNAKNTQLEPPA